MTSHDGKIFAAGLAAIAAIAFSCLLLPCRDEPDR
jgi:hypothetical protein